MATKKGGKKGNRLEAAGGLLPAPVAAAVAQVAAGGVEGVHGAIRRKPGPRADPAKRALKKYLLKLHPEHANALHRAALDRCVAGKDKRPDAGGVLRSLLDAWIAKGAKAP